MLSNGASLVLGARVKNFQNQELDYQKAQLLIRELDTRTIHSPLAAHATDTINILNYAVAGCPCADAMVDNIAVTAPAKAGVLTVYPAGQPRPLASNLNFSAGETVPNLVTVAGGNGKFSYYNDSPGSLQLVIDEYGYYIVAS